MRMLLRGGLMGGEGCLLRVDWQAGGEGVLLRVCWREGWGAVLWRLVFGWGTCALS